MADLIWVIQVQGTDTYVKTVVPLTTTGNLSEAHAYQSQQDATTDATYLNSLKNGNSYFVGHVPRPH